MNGEKKVILVNLLSLLFVQFANYALQLITFPYLVRALGIADFGLYSFVFAFIQYFLVFTDYGFNLTATRLISIHRNDAEKRSEIFSSVMLIKLALFLVGSAIILLLLFTVKVFVINRGLYLLAMTGILGSVIFPVWYFQGIEKTKYVAIFNSIAKVITTVGIFIFVKKGGIANAIFIQSLGPVIAGVISLFFIIYKWPIKITIPNNKKIKYYLKDGWNVFITILSATLVNNTNIFILGLLTNNQTVGYFSIAEKTVRIFHSLVSPVSTAIFPHVSNLMSKSREKVIKFLRKILISGVLCFLICSICLIVFSDAFVRLFSGQSSKNVQVLIIILSILPVTIFINNIYGQQILINIGRASDFMKAIIFPGIVSVVLSFIFVPIFKEYGTAIIYLSSEISILLLMIIFVRKESIYIIKNKLM